MKRADSLSNNDLMAACRENGKGGGWEAEAIEHWRWQMANGEGKERVLAWVKLHSIARGSPKCIDEAGHPLRVESCAADLGLALKTVQNHCTDLVAEGRIRLKKAQLWYRADVPEEIPLPAAPVADATMDERSWVSGNFADYVADSYWKKSATDRAHIRVEYDAFAARRQKAFLEALARVRNELSRVEGTMLHSLGLPKNVQAERAPKESRWFEVSLLDEESLVHGNSAADRDNAVYSAESGGVQTGPSLLPFRPDQTSEPLTSSTATDDAAGGPPSDLETAALRASGFKTLSPDDRRFLMGLVDVNPAIVRAGILTARARRFKSGATDPPRSLRYFANAIEEARSGDLTPGYADHVEHWLARHGAKSKAKGAGDGS